MSTEVTNSRVGSTLPTFGLTHGASIDPPPLTPYRVIHRGGKASVRHYKAVGPRHQVPIVLVYALIKRPFVLDLERGRSVVEDLTRQGFEVFLIDWLPPNAADSWRGFDAYVNQDLDHAVHAVRIHQGVEQVARVLAAITRNRLVTIANHALAPIACSKEGTHADFVFARSSTHHSS